MTEITGSMPKTELACNEFFISGSAEHVVDALIRLEALGFIKDSHLTVKVQVDLDTELFDPFDPLHKT